uniref:G_PROTEIN_RECEP_F1_2 domain-containing protein n=1 Tax=Globodera pallida TaxID=36090 RepID=A0A183CJ40_GLOPA
MYDNASSDMDFVDLLNTGLTNTAFKQFTFVCLIISGTLNMRLLLLARFRPAVLRVPELSRALVVYLCFHCAGAILSLPYNAYMLIKFYYGTKAWHTPRTVYTIFWLGIWQSTYTAISPLAVLFLTMERCFIIKLATNSTKRKRLGRWMCRASIATLLAAFSASTAIYMNELPLNIDNLKLSNCASVSCLMLKWHNLVQLFFKCSVSFLNIFWCLYLIYSLRTFSAMKIIKNDLVIVTICFELCFNFLPAFVSICFKFFGKGLLSNVASTCSILDACCCAIYYTLVLVPPRCLKRANASVNSTNETRPSPSSPQHQQQLQQMPSFRMQPSIVLPRD